MQNLVDFLKVPESMSKFDHDNYILSLIFANEKFFKFEVIDNDLKVSEKDSGKEVFYNKNYFMSNEIIEYQKKSLVCDDEFELDLPLKATLGDIMYFVNIDWKYDEDYRIVGISNISTHNVKVTEITGSSDTSISFESKDLATGEEFFEPQCIYFYSQEEADSFIDKLLTSGTACHTFYQNYEKDLESIQYYRYRIRSHYKFNQVLSPAELRALRVSCNTSMTCSRFVFDLLDYRSSGTIQFKAKFFDEKYNLFIDIPSDELVCHDTGANADLYTFIYQGKKLSRVSTSVNVEFDTIFSIVKVKED